VSEDAVASAMVATAQVVDQPRLQVLVTGDNDRAQHAVTAIADTGAQVCVAGPALMNALSLTPKHLQGRAGL